MIAGLNMADKFKKVAVADLDLELRTEVIDGEDMDTEISIYGNVIVSGSEKENFVKEFEKLVANYRI